MRILQVITSLRTGGAERLVVDLSKRMAEAGDSVEVLLFDGTRTALYEELEQSGVKVHSLGSGTAAMHNPLLALRLRRFLKRNRYDVVHAHNAPCQYLAAIAAPRPSLVTTEHGTVNRRRSLPFLRPVERRMYSRYRSIVCVSEETREGLSRWLGRERLDARMSVIPNGIDFGRIADARPDPQWAQDPRFKVLMVSAFRPEKDQMTLVRAMRELPADYLLLLAGGAELPAHKALLEACRRAAAEWGVGDRVQFLGPRNDIPSLLAAADAVVLSSLHEGLSLSVLEGMASGSPVIASDVKGMREIVSGAGLLFPQGDAEALAALIRDVCEHPDKAQETGDRCKACAQRYDIARTARRYLLLYEEVMASCAGNG